jgi:NAD(P)-dependent dehydrogenase (short-subunit alcohol dehydrogenase family)
MAELEGRVAVVTGAARGLGRETALVLAERGCHLVVNYKNAETEESAREVARRICAMGRQAAAVAADVSVNAEVEAMFQYAIETFGTVDILVNNAGTARAQNILETSEADWHYLLDTNLTSCYLCSRAALRIMAAQRGGTIVNISSVAGERGHLCGQVHYAASKSGIVGLTKTVARTAAPFGVRVNAVAPGLIETDLLRSTHSPEELTELVRDIPLGIGTPRDVALAVAFLCGEGGRYITGATLDVNGGAYMR